MRLPSFSRLTTGRLPIAWLLLLRFPPKFFTAIVGIIFATLLILSQLGLRAALFDSSISIFRNLNADLIVTNVSSVGSPSLQGFAQERLAIFDRYQEVASTSPLRYNFVRWKYKDTSASRIAIMVGFDPRSNAFNQADIIKNQHLLLLPGRILYDELSRKEFGPVKTTTRPRKADTAFVNNQRVDVAEFVRIGTSFSYDACFLASLPTFESVSFDLPNNVEIGLVKLNPGVDVQKLIGQIRPSLPADIRILTKREFLDFEKNYWDQSKPIGFVFFFNAVLGFIVGMVILYQILYTDVADNLPTFSMMLALAHTYMEVRLIVFRESFYLAIIGFPLGVCVCAVVFNGINAATGLGVSITIERALVTFSAILFMSTCAALMAMFKLDEANPVEIFE